MNELSKIDAAGRWRTSKRRSAWAAARPAALGKTAGRGGKGQKARTGNMNFIGFEGGQMPIQRRIPKRGFTNPFRVEYALVNVAISESLVFSRWISTSWWRRAPSRSARAALKVLGDGELTRAVSVKAAQVLGLGEREDREGGREGGDHRRDAKTTPQQRKAEEKKAAKAAKT